MFKIVEWVEDKIAKEIKEAKKGAIMSNGCTILGTYVNLYTTCMKEVIVEVHLRGKTKKSKQVGTELVIAHLSVAPLTKKKK